MKSKRKRKSCVFDNIQPKVKIYNDIPNYNWKDAPDIIKEICKLIEQYTKEKYDYVLVHIYPSGNASINWHSDSEAIDSSIASVSLGATRKFRFKKIGRKEGWDSELYLNNGDLVWMHGPDPITDRLSCQRVYLHTVPVEKKVKGPRINLTFRQY